MASTFKLPEPTDPDKCPEPKLALITKYDLYKKPSEYFKENDSHARNIALNNYKSFEELMYHLIYSKKLNEIEKTRVCFIYLISKDCKSLSFMNVVEGTVEAFIMSIIDSPIFYPKMYEILCSYAGLNCKLIEGYVKGFEFLPGDTFPNDECNHLWVAVYINNSCYLVDPLWAKRYIEFEHPLGKSVNSDPNQLKIIKECEEFYFLMDPAQAVFSHFPKDTKWQLLGKNTVPYNIFLQMPVVKPQFFRASLEFTAEHRGVFHLPKGELILRFNYTSGSAFYFELLIFDGDKLTQKYNNVDLAKYTLLDTKRQCVEVYFRLPFAGQYIFVLYNEHVSNETLPSNYFRAVCLYRLVCESPSPNLTQFPGYTEINWGPGWTYFDYYGISSTNHRNGIVSLNRSEPAYIEFFFMYFKEKYNLKTRLTKRVLNSPLNSNQFEDASFLLDDKEKGYNIAFTIRLPHKGYYGFELFLGTDEDSSDNNYVHLAQYLIEFNQEDSCNLLNMLDCSTFPPLPMPDPYLFMEKEVVAVTVMDPDTDSLYPTSVKTKQSSDSSISMGRQIGSKLSGRDTSYHSAWDSFLSRNKDNLAACIKKFIIDPSLLTPYNIARAIFLWLCRLNVESIDTSIKANNELEELTYFLKKGEVTYAHIYDALVTICNINCQIISGHAKGFNYQMMKHLNNSTLHCWNVIEIDNSWKQVDCNWGAKSMVGQTVDSAVLVYELVEFFFCPPPEKFIYSHLPSDSKYTLLKEDVPEGKFENMVPLKPLFFELGMQLLTHKSSMISAENTLLIRLAYSASNSQNITFGFNMLTLHNKMQYNGANLSRYVIQNHHRSTNNLEYHFRFPAENQYKFIVYTYSDTNMEFRAVCEYIIQAKVDNLNKRLQAYPPAEQPFYGKTICGVENNVELIAKFDECLLKSNGEDIIIEFRMPLSPYGIPNFIPRLQSNEISSTSCDNMIEFKGTRKGRLYSWVLTIHCDNIGEYSLEIFMNNPTEKANDEHNLIWQFMVNIENKMGANNSASYYKYFYSGFIKKFF